MCQLLDIPKFNTKPEIKSNIAQAKYHIALKKYDENSFDESATLFLKAIELDQNCLHFENVYECLANCYKNKHETSQKGTKEIQDKTYKVIYTRFEK